MNEFIFQKQYGDLFLPLGMYVLRIVRDTDAAQDIVQSAFEAAWLRVDEIQNLKSYMYRTVYNAAIQWLREKNKTTVLSEEMDIAVNDHNVNRSERDAQLWKAIDGLPERCREIFLMSKRDGMSYGEIA